MLVLSIPPRPWTANVAVDRAEILDAQGEVIARLPVRGDVETVKALAALIVGAPDMAALVSETNYKLAELEEAAGPFARFYRTTQLQRLRHQWALLEKRMSEAVFVPGLPKISYARLMDGAAAVEQEAA